VPITPYLTNQAFEPEVLEEMSAAFVKTCRALGLEDRPDKLTELVAQHIIEMAQRGIRGRTALYFGALEKFTSDPQ